MKIDWRSFTKKFVKDPDDFPFGMVFYDGVMGSGKTLTMVKDALDICKKYDDVLLISNVHFKVDTGAKEVIYFLTINELIAALEKSQNRKHTWVIIDEALSYFAENGGIDPALMNKITQSRSCRRLICLGSQQFKRVNNRLRDFSMQTIICRNVGRLQINSVRDDKKLHFDKNEMDFVGPVIERRIFKRNKELFDAYDTFEGVKLNTSLSTSSLLQPAAPPPPAAQKGKGWW
jgi:hypothetical protein